MVGLSLKAALRRHSCQSCAVVGLFQGSSGKSAGAGKGRRVEEGHTEMPIHLSPVPWASRIFIWKGMFGNLIKLQTSDSRWQLSCMLSIIISLSSIHSVTLLIAGHCRPAQIINEGRYNCSTLERPVKILWEERNCWTIEKGCSLWLQIPEDQLKAPQAKIILYHPASDFELKSGFFLSKLITAW